MIKQKPKISIIAAIAKKNRAIGKDNKLLWHISNDFKHFKKITSGHPVIMGYKTYLSIGKALPNRLNIVLSKNDVDIIGVTVCKSIPDAIAIAGKQNNDEIFFIGGGSVYEQAIKFADKLYLTLISGDFDGDVFFPDYSEFNNIIYRKDEESDGYKYSFVELEKK